MFCEKRSFNSTPIEYFYKTAEQLKAIHTEYGGEIPEDKKEKYEHEIHCITAVTRDRNKNLIKWVNGEPCSFVHPDTGNLVEVKIGNDGEAIIRFLDFCWKLHNNVEIDDDELAYLAYIIARSNFNGEEC